LLDCVVFGRVAGKHCAKYMLGAGVKETSLITLSGGGLSGAVESSKNAGGSYEDGMNKSAAAAKKKEKKEKKSGGGGGGMTMEEVAKHTSKTDCWVVVAGQVLDVTKFLGEHPGGELAILTFAGKDATEEFNMIHPPDVIPKYAPDAIIGELGAGGGGGDAADDDDDESDDDEGEAEGGAYTMEDVAKHTSKTDCWVVVAGQVLDVTKFLGEHPGGELAILTFAGKDATEEFNMIHPPDVIPKYAPDAIIGVVGAAKAKKVKAPKAGAAAPARKDKGDLIPNHQAWGHLEGTENWRLQGQTDNPGVMLIPVAQYLMATWYLLLAVLYEVCATIFSAPNLKISNDRVGLTRSAILLILFIVIHAVGNLHVFMGPDDFNGYGYFYVRLYWTGFGLPANIVEEYILLAVLLHVFVALKRTWDISLAYSVGSGKLNLAITGIALLTFMTVHLFQFRFGETQMYKVCPPPYLVNLWTLLQLKLNLFWVDTPGCETSEVRDIYRLEFEVFQSVGWCAFYLLSVGIFATHMALGWAKVVPAAAMGIPKGHQKKATIIGYAITFVIAAIYASFPIYTHFRPMVDGALSPEPALP